MSEKIKAFLRSNFLTRAIYMKLAKSHHKKVLKRKRKMMAANGVQTIHCLQNLFTEIGCKFFFDMGTLLGIPRDGQLLQHDIDIDVAVFVESEEQKLTIRDMIVSHGNDILYSYSVDGIGIVEESYVHSGIKFDINYYTREQGVDICYLMYCDPEKVYESKDELSVVRLECSSIEEIIQIDFNGAPINVPNDSKSYLEQRYGKTWTIPDKNYVYWKGPSTHPTDKIGLRAVYK